MTDDRKQSVVNSASVLPGPSSCRTGAEKSRFAKGLSGLLASLAAAGVIAAASLLSADEPVPMLGKVAVHPLTTQPCPSDANKAPTTKPVTPATRPAK